MAPWPNPEGSHTWFIIMFRNVCFTLNNPEGTIEFDSVEMEYLIYQEEQPEGGTYHFQGYCEFKKRTRLAKAKALLGGPTVHIEARRGTQAQAIAYCKKDDTRVAHTTPYEEGEPRAQGKRLDLEGFKDAVLAGKRKRDLLDDHVGVMARYPKFYDMLTMMNRPTRSVELQVTLLYGVTGLGKTRSVMDKYSSSEEFWIAPLNNGTIWMDTYDGHKVVLIDDFAGAASHCTLCYLLRLLDRYPVLVPTKGSHTWWLPNEVFITTNILPKLWFKWEGREGQYKALARRFTAVREYYVSLPGTHSSYITQNSSWWEENKPDEVIY